MKPPLILSRIRSKPATIWTISSLVALINRLIYSLTIACLPDLLQKELHVPRADNGVITAAFGVGGLLAGCSIGYISDRMQNRLLPQILACLLYVISGVIFLFTRRFYQIVVFRLVLGAASSIADTMLFTTVADVYPANLLGFKMAVLFVFDNVGNMLGPVVGGKAYEKMGVEGIAVIVIGLGVAEMLVIAVFVRNSISIRMARYVSSSSSRGACISSVSDIMLESTVASSRQSDSNCAPQNGDSARDGRGASSKACLTAVNSRSETLSQCTGCSSDDSSSFNSRSDHGAGMQLWRLMLKTPVIGPTVSIFVGTGLQSVVETVFPLRLSDKFNYSPGKIGVAFLIVDGILILAMPLVGYVNDTIISKRGEAMRYYAIALGALCVFASLAVISVAQSYTVLVVGYSLFTVTSMVVVLPAQSAFGDFINATESNAMAQCYSLASVAEGLANISLPPIATGMYAVCGFLPMLVSMSATLCLACAVTVLAFPLQQRWRSQTRQ